MQDDFYDRYKGKEGNGVPKYLQLGEAMTAAIKEGYWKPGSKVPAEAAIVRSTALSLGTVQKALRLLADQGLIERRHGHGTFVSKTITAPWHFRFFEETKGSFLPLYSKVVGRRIVTKKDRWAALLSPGGRDLVQIDRTIDVGRRTLVYNVFYISLEKYPAFWKKSIEELDSANLKTILQQEHKESATRASNFIRTVTLPRKVCAALGLKRATIGSLLETVACSSSKNPLYFSELYIPPTQLRLFISDSPSMPQFWL